MTITDTCKCGAKFQVVGGSTYEGIAPSHTEWLEAHKVCRDNTEPPKPRSAEQVAVKPKSKGDTK